MNMTRLGGSSIVFKSALNACFDSMCISSMIKTLYPVDVNGGMRVDAMMLSRTLSTCVCVAASISMMSSERSASICVHDSHELQGSKVPASRCKQFTDLAKRRAIVV